MACSDWGWVIVSTAAERWFDRSGRSSRGASLPSRMVMRAETSSSSVFRMVFTSSNRVTKEDCISLRCVSNFVCISVIRLLRDSNIDNFWSICWSGSLGVVCTLVWEAEGETEGDSEAELVSVGCSVELFPLMESLLIIRICLSYTAATSFDSIILTITNWCKCSAGGMIYSSTMLTCVMFCFDDLFAASTCLVHLKGK